jgi:hypothetical protein
MGLYFGVSKNYKKGFILQKRAMRILAKVSRTTSCKPSFRVLKIMTWPYKTNSKIHLHDTRQKSDLFITGHNPKLFEQSTTYSGIHIYNRLAEIPALLGWATEPVWTLWRIETSCRCLATVKVQVTLRPTTSRSVSHDVFNYY